MPGDEPRRVGAILYIAVDVESKEAAEVLLARFVGAGLNLNSPVVHVAIGDPSSRRGNDMEHTNQANGGT